LKKKRREKTIRPDAAGVFHLSFPLLFEFVGNPFFNSTQRTQCFMIPSFGRSQNGRREEKANARKTSPNHQV
jgi:hypothetical protein